MNYFFRAPQKKDSKPKSATVIRYDKGEDKPPTIVAQGQGAVAQKIIEMAEKHGIPMENNPLLVENLIDMDLGENIPPQLYMVIAEILLMIEEMEKNY